MANIPTTPTWSPDVYQIETTDAVLGGADGVINVQAKQLADRTAYLKQEVEAAGAVASNAENKATSALSQIAAVEQAAGSAVDAAAEALAHKNAAQAAEALAVQARQGADAAAAQAGDNASYAVQAAGTSTQKAQQAQAAATAAVSASSAAAGARDAALQAKADTQAALDGAVAEINAAAISGVNQIAAERADIIATGEAKKAEIGALSAGSMVDITNARDAALAAKDVSVTKAAEATLGASTATAQAGIATNQAGLATNAKTSAESARDAALIQAGVYATESAGRAAVADGVAFKVQGSGDVAAYEYRRTNSTTSVLIATYPSKAAYDTLALKQKLKADVELGKNLFNPNDPDVVVGYYVNDASGALLPNAVYSATGWIPVTPGATYTQNRSSEYRCAWYDSNKTYISGGMALTVTAPAGAAFLRFSYYTSVTGSFQIEVGSTSTFYAPYSATAPPSQLRAASVSESKIAPASVGYDKTKFIKTGKNLFNILDPNVVLGKFVDKVTGSLNTNASYNTTGFIPVVAGSAYTVSTKTYLGWYDANRAFIFGSAETDTNKTQAAPAGAAYLRASAIVGAAWNQFQVELGTSSTAFEPFSLSTYSDTNTPVYSPIKDGAVTISKASFFSVGKNKYNKATTTFGYYIGGSGIQQAGASYDVSDFIAVTPGVTYCTPRFRFTCYYDANKNFLPGGSASGGTTFTPPAGAAFVRVTLYAGDSATFQMEVGTSNTAYESYRYVIENTESSVPLHINPFPVGKNKFNKNAIDVAVGYYVNNANGALAANPTYNATGFIPVVGGATYTLSYKHMIAWYDANKTYISGSNSTNTNKTQTAPANAVYLRATVAATVWSSFQVELGTSQTSYQSYGYTLEGLDSYPIRVNSSNIIYPDSAVTGDLAISAKQYVPAGKEIALYHENIVKDYPTHRGRTGISFSGGKEVGPSTKISPTVGQVGSTISGSAVIADASFVTLASKSFSIIVSDPSKTTAANIQNIGDSFTGRMTWANIINATAAASGLTFSGIRTSNSATPSVKCEGRGGWTMDNYFTVDRGATELSPFMQPVNSGYFYYGQTSFWIDANSASPSYAAGYYTGTKDLFNPSTGRKLSPNVGDIMGESGGYIQWNGSAWVSISSVTFGGFAFSYAKYRQAWNVPAPTILHVLLGTNDFYSATEADFATRYAAYKTKYDALIASVKADTPGVKIVIGIPVSSGRQGKWGTLTTEKVKRAMFLLANSLNIDYGGREAESIYLLDYHSIVDRFYGFDNTYEPPFSDYTGTAGDDLYKADVTHLGADGFKQMGNAYMGLIQYLR